jgi:hypothetical protein
MAVGSTQPTIQQVQAANWHGREDDRSPPASAKDKKTWICTSTPPYVFMV